MRVSRPEGEAALERSLRGLLTARPNTHCDTLAEAVPGTSEQRLQELLTNRPWDAQDLNRPRVAKRIAEATVGHGVLMVDDTGFAKQGKASVGVARQSAGPWARWAIARSRCRAAPAIRTRAGPWRCACPCPRTGRPPPSA